MALTRLHSKSGGGTALVTTLALVPLLTLALGIGATSMADLAPGVETAAYALVLGAAVLTYLHWRMAVLAEDDPLAGRLAGWLTVGLTGGAVNGLLQAAPFDRTASGPDRWSLVAQLVLLLVLSVAATLAERVDVPGNPALLGVLVAVVITAAHTVALRGAPALALDGAGAALLVVAVALAGLCLASILLRLTEVSSWARQRLALAVVLLTAAECTTELRTGEPLLTAAALVAYLLGALILCALTQELLRESALEHQAELAGLQQSLAQVRAAVLEDRELLHEVGATLAGISNASAVIRQGPSVPAHRRQRLETMLVAELARLERLMLARSAPADDGEDREIDLDAVVEPLVTSHQTRGRDVRWTPGGLRATGDPDELAEVVNILLENAAAHAPGSVVRLSVGVAGDEIVAICSDSGPGVPSELRPHLFDRDVRRPGSPGHGLGLAIARRLATARGGSLELVDADRPGATFVARLPRKELAHGAASHVA